MELRQARAVGALSGLISALLIYAPDGYRFSHGFASGVQEDLRYAYYVPGLPFGLLLPYLLTDAKARTLLSRIVLLAASVGGHAIATVIALYFSEMLPAIVVGGTTGATCLAFGAMLMLPQCRNVGFLKRTAIGGVFASTVFYLIMLCQLNQDLNGINMWVAYALWQAIVAGALTAASQNLPIER